MSTLYIPFLISFANELIDYDKYNVQAVDRADVSVVCRPEEKISFIARRAISWKGDIKKDRARSELQSRIKIPNDKIVNLSYDIMVSSREIGSIENLVIGQFHQTSDFGDFEGYPALEISWKQQGLSVYTASDSNRLTPRHYPNIVRVDSKKFSFNKWHTIKIMAKFSFRESAILKVALDDKEIVNLSGISMGFNDELGPYWKFGAYFRSKNMLSVVKATYRNVDFSQVGGSPTKCRSK